MAHLSISIDLCGSTRLKQELVAISNGDTEVRDALYQRYLNLLFKIERDFYEIIGNLPVLKIESLYLVKLIGDEFWFLYDTDDNSFEEEASALIKSLFTLLEQERIISFHEEGGKARSYDLPLKIFVDRLSGQQELSQARYEFLKDLILKQSSKSNGVLYSVNSEFLAVCHRLNLASSSPSDKNEKAIASRPDFIGLETDRFFRLTKMVFPQLLMIGDALFTQMGLTYQNAHDEHHRLELGTVSFPSVSEKYYAIPRTVESIEMKGLSHNYQVYYLFNKRVFKNALKAPELDMENLLGDTRAFLAQKGFFALEGK